jgi:hypothetical protein
MTEKQVVAALRIWLDTPDLMASYERRGVVVVTVALRMEAAKAAVTGLGEMLALYASADAGDPGRVEALNEILDMAREALSGGPGQILPLTNEIASPLDALFGEVS